MYSKDVHGVPGFPLWWLQRWLQKASADLVRLSSVCAACLAESEAVGFSPSVEEFDLESAILNAAPLANQLVEALIIRSSLPLARQRHFRGLRRQPRRR